MNLFAASRPRMLSASSDEQANHKAAHLLAVHNDIPDESGFEEYDIWPDSDFD